MSEPRIIVLGGSGNEEHDISVVSAEEAFKLLEQEYDAQLRILDEIKIPEDLDPQRDIIFSMLHGVGVEDGYLQGLLDAAGFTYTGSGQAASELCMHKTKTKAVAHKLGIPSAPYLYFEPGEGLRADRILENLMVPVFIKPDNGGSSVDSDAIFDEAALEAFVSKSDPSRGWLVEAFIAGVDLSIGVYSGGPMAITQIEPKEGFYDYHNKYTPGATEYTCPAPIDGETEALIKEYAWKMYQACGCSDAVRVDFRLGEGGGLYFLEVNTAPGFTPLSLIVKCAHVLGISPEQHLQTIANAAIERLNEKSYA